MSKYNEDEEQNKPTFYERANVVFHHMKFYPFPVTNTKEKSGESSRDRKANKTGDIQRL